MPMATVRSEFRELSEPERFEELFDRDAAPLDLLGGDGLEQPAELLAPQPAGDRNGLGSQLLEQHLLGGAAAHREGARQTLEEDEPPRGTLGACRWRLAAPLLRRGAGRGPHRPTGRRAR